MTLNLVTRFTRNGKVTSDGKLILVDLAGSERLSNSDVSGERLRETQCINRSLSALADVVAAKERRLSHIPYRNSKLTQLLQDALGGQEDCHTVFIIAVPPTWANVNDTLRALQFGSRLTSLSIPTVVSRRPLCHSSSANACLERRGLKLEISRWRMECAKSQAELEECRCELDRKQTELEEAARQNVELKTWKRQISRPFDVLETKLQKAKPAAIEAFGAKFYDWYLEESNSRSSLPRSGSTTATISRDEVVPSVDSIVVPQWARIQTPMGCAQVKILPPPRLTVSMPSSSSSSLTSKTDDYVCAAGAGIDVAFASSRFKPPGKKVDQAEHGIERISQASTAAGTPLPAWVVPPNGVHLQSRDRQINSNQSLSGEH